MTEFVLQQDIERLIKSINEASRKPAGYVRPVSTPGNREYRNGIAATPEILNEQSVIPEPTGRVLKATVDDETDMHSVVCY